MATYRKKLLDKDGNTIIPAMAGDETGWVNTADLADGSVTSAKFAQYAVNSAINTADNLSPNTDTPTAWKTLLGDGYFITRYTSNSFSGQPEQYGILETIIDSNRVFQRWQSLSTNPFYYRGGNDTGWNGSSTYPSTFSTVPNNDYSTTERIFGTWIDGKIIYKKTINFGALPNSTEKTVAHGITNIDKIIKIEAWAYRASPVTFTNLPYVYAGDVGSDIGIAVSASSIAINAAANRSNFTECYVTLYYTKSS